MKTIKFIVLRNFPLYGSYVNVVRLVTVHIVKFLGIFINTTEGTGYCL